MKASQILMIIGMVLIAPHLPIAAGIAAGLITLVLSFMVREDKEDEE